MAQPNPMNKIIRFVDANHKVTLPEECVVAIDSATRKAISVVDLQGTMQLERTGVFGLFRERKHVLVVNTSHGRREAEGKVPTIDVRDFGRQWTLGLKVNYLASVSRGNEAKVAQVLAAGQSPEAELNTFITRWIEDYAGTNPGVLIDNFYDRKADLQAHLAAKAREEIGLNLQALIHLESEDEALQTIRLNQLCFPVRVNDYHEEQPLKLEAEIGVYAPARICAVIHHPGWFRASNGTLKEPVRLEELIKSEARHFFATKISLHTFLSELRSARLTKELTEQLNVSLRKFGREVSTLSLEYKGTIDSSVRLFYETKEKVEVKGLQEYDQYVEIRSSVQMNLRDYALYRLSGGQDLESWLKKNLAEVVNQILFGKRYLDLLIGFDPLKAEIKEKLSLRAERIGYNIKQLITVPNLPPYDWLDNIRIEIEKEEFETKTPKFAVNLGIYVDARIRSLRDIESYLNRSQDVPVLMRQTIVSEAKKLLHTIDPERYYMRFSYADPNRGETKSVEEILGDRIRQSLEVKFKADVTDVTIKMLDTDLTNVWSELEMAEGELDINLPSLSDIEGVTYYAGVRVDAIHANGWDRFRTTRPTMDKVRQSIAKHISARLGTLAYADTAYTRIEIQNYIEGTIEGLARKFALEEFGLVIRVNSIHRDATEIEIAEKQRIKELLDTIRTLESKRLQEIANHGAPALIQSLTDRINQLKAELPETVRATVEKFSRPELIESAGPTRLREYGQIIGSLGAGDSNGNESSKTETAGD